MKKKEVDNTNKSQEFLSGSMSFLEKTKYKLHKSVSRIFNDEDFVKNYVNLENNYSAIKDIIPTWLYDEEYECFINDNSIGFVLEGNTISGADEKTVKTITNLITDGVPEGTIIQINNYASPKVNNILDLWESSRKSSSEIHKTLTEKRRKYFEHANWTSLFSTPFVIRDFRLVMTVSIPLKNIDGDDILSKLNNLRNKITKKAEKKMEEKTKKKFLSEVQKLRRLKNAFTSTLKSVGIYTFEYKDRHLVSYLDELINPNIKNKKSSPLGYRADSSISNQINVDNVMSVEEDHISLFADNPDKKVCVKSFNVKTYPEIFALWQGVDLVGEYYNDLSQIPCPFVSSFTIVIPKNLQAKHASVQAKGARAIQQSETALAKYMPELREKAEDFKFVGRHIREGQKLVEIYFQLTLFSPPDLLPEATQIATSIYKKKSFNMVSERYMQLQSYMSLIPFNMGEGLFDDMSKGGRTDTALTWTCANLMPLIAEPLGYIDSPAMMLFGRRGQPLFWNPFANKGGNYNTAVVGKSGAGKSLFMQELVSSLLRMGGKVYVIDDGRSFMNICKLQEGQFMEFVHNATICLNPFSLLKNEKARDHYSIDDVLERLDNESEEELAVDNASEILILINSMIRQMARSQSLTCEIENAFISEAIDIAYKEKKHKATITTVRDILNDSKDKRSQDIARMLRPFTKDGEYAAYFEGDCNVSIESFFMVFELSEIKNKKDLQRIVMQFIMFLVFQKMYMGDRKQTISIVIDEAWDLLHGEETGKFIEGLARRARKYNGNIITGTQSVNDYYKTPATKAIIENSDWTCLLAQKPESVDAFKNSGRVSMDDEMERTLKSIKMVEYKYSEIMIYGAGGYVVGRLIVDPYSIALYSTKAEDFTKVQELTKQGYSTREALDMIVGDNSISEEKINKAILKHLEKVKSEVILELSEKNEDNYEKSKSIVSDKIHYMTNSLNTKRL